MKLPPDLELPETTTGQPAPGKRVVHRLPAYTKTQVHHLLYLPTDWSKDKTYPVIIEYPGNGPFQNQLGDTCSGEIDSCKLGYGISEGKGVIWVSMPIIAKDHQQHQRKWWGDLEATVDYCKQTVAMICKDFGGDPKQVFIAGFSRGAIACNYIGLHDDDIAALWAGFICHSHYDGVRDWGYPNADRNSATSRLKRLGKRPQFISHEGNVDATRNYLKEASPNGNFTYQPMSFSNHTDLWVLRDCPERQALRKWFNSLNSDRRNTRNARQLDEARGTKHESR